MTSDQPPLAPDALALRLDGETLLVPLERVETVTIAPPITRAPGTPRMLAGAINHLGSIHPAVEIGEPSQPRRHAVLVRTERYGVFALLCDWADSLVLATEQVGARRLDVDALADQVIAAYDGLEQELPTATRPGPRIRLRRTPTETGRTG